MILPALRRAVTADLPALARIEHAAHLHPWNERLLAQELENPRARILVAEVEGVPGAFLCAWLVADELQILDVATHPDFRRRGLARELLLRAHADAVSEGATVALLEVRKGNPGAIALYERLGYAKVGERPKYYEPDGEDAILMDKRLVLDP